MTDQLTLGVAMARSEASLLIVQARLAARITQVQLAQRLGVSPGYISQLESTNTNPTVATLGRVLAAMGQRMAFTVQPLMEGRRDVSV